MAHVSSISKYALYRFFGIGRQLLYIGISGSLPTRLGQHAKQKDWWHEVVSVEVQHFDTKEAVLGAEKSAIESERPAYNVVYNSGAEARELRTEEIESGERINFDGSKAFMYGTSFWTITLPGGGYVCLAANRIEPLSGGALVAWGCAYELTDAEGRMTRYDYTRPKEAERPLVGFAAGGWESFYASSMWTGDPVSVDYCRGWRL